MDVPPSANHGYYSPSCNHAGALSHFAIMGVIPILPILDVIICNPTPLENKHKHPRHIEVDNDMSPISGLLGVANLILQLYARGPERRKTKRGRESHGLAPVAGEGASLYVTVAVSWQEV
jgi:hypothetical protein